MPCPWPGRERSVPSRRESSQIRPSSGEAPMAEMASRPNCSRRGTGTGMRATVMAVQFVDCQQNASEHIIRPSAGPAQIRVRPPPHASALHHRTWGAAMDGEIDIVAGGTVATEYGVFRADILVRD